MTKEFDKRNMAKSRRVCEDMEAAHVTKWLKLTERERQILAMWPRFEDDEYVWFGDAYIDTDGDASKVRAIEFDEGCTDLVGIEGFHTGFFAGERAKRPAPEVLDADGVEIKVGDTVWYRNLCTKDYTSKATVVGFYEYRQDVQLVTLLDEMGWTCHIDPKRITHTPPDSWERLEEDAEFNDETGIVGGNLDIVRRAKALAGVEVDE